MIELAIAAGIGAGLFGVGVFAGYKFACRAMDLGASEQSFAQMVLDHETEETYDSGDEWKRV